MFLKNRHFSAESGKIQSGKGTDRPAAHNYGV
jgi:hypothetical protein